jgi:hypothetical protein
MLIRAAAVMGFISVWQFMEMEVPLHFSKVRMLLSPKPQCTKMLHQILQVQFTWMQRVC